MNGKTKAPVFLRGFFIWLAVLSGLGASAGASEKLKIAVHLHTTFSTGSLTPAEVASEAEKAGLDGVIFTDSLQRRWEYGLWPLRGVIKKTVEQPSILQAGAKRYFDAVKQAQAAHPKLILIAAAEAAPAYYWRRSPFDRLGGEIRGWNRHLLLFGLDEAHLASLPFNADPYNGDQGSAAYQRFIDAAVAAGGTVFWAHPEIKHEGSHSGVAEFTEAYPYLLEATTRYQGFAITYFGYLKTVQPGDLWDRLLLAYLQGKRAQPVWMLGELDWRGPQERPLDMVLTEVWVAQRTPEAVLAALSAGNSQAAIRAKNSQLQLDRFTVGMDDAKSVKLEAAGRCSAGNTAATLTLVKNGAVFIRQAIDEPSFALQWSDPAEPPAYYRLILEDPTGVIYTNPIFVR